MKISETEVELSDSLSLSVCIIHGEQPEVVVQIIEKVKSDTLLISAILEGGRSRERNEVTWRGRFPLNTANTIFSELSDVLRYVQLIIENEGAHIC